MSGPAVGSQFTLGACAYRLGMRGALSSAKAMDKWIKDISALEVEANAKGMDGWGP